MIDDLRVHDAGPDHPGLQCALQLVLGQAEEQKCIGTAFSVAPGLAITAAHVVDEYLQRGQTAKSSNDFPPLIATQLFQGKVLVWIVDAIYGSVASDIAFLRFLRPQWWGDGPGQVKPRYPRLRFNPPAPGDTLLMFGFPQSKVSHGVVTISPVACQCRVVRVDLKSEFPNGYRPLSHIDVEGELLDGMSGGPCFDGDWNVLGVNSKGWDGLQLAHVALLWPAMGVPIDLFKTGDFPVVEMFNQGPARAIGYRRLQVTATGEARLGRVDPDELASIGPFGSTQNLGTALDFAAVSAQEALAEIRISAEKCLSGSGVLETNVIVRNAKHFFGELESVLTLSLLLAASRMDLNLQECDNWEGFIGVCEGKVETPRIMDELRSLGFSWHGIDLFEIRAYSKACRSGFLMTEASTQLTGRVVALSLGPTYRKGGQQIFLPDGLDRFMASTKHFVNRLLGLSRDAVQQVGS